MFEILKRHTFLGRSDRISGDTSGQVHSSRVMSDAVIVEVKFEFTFSNGIIVSTYGI